jgi:hypothetical protein
MGIGGPAAWRVVALAAAVFFGCYLVWLVAFERWLEPALRRCVGLISGRCIVWVPAGKRFRIWGLRDAGSHAAEAGVALLGAAVVVCSALLPAVVLARAVGAHMGDPIIAATTYLTAVPVMALFVLRVLSAHSHPTDRSPRSERPAG